MNPLLWAAAAAVLGAAPPPPATPAAAPGAARATAAALPAKAADKDAMVCKTKTMSGTRVKSRKLCGKAKDWNQASDAARGAADEVRDAARGGCAPGTCGGV
jgi:hypothetical protein